MKETRKKIGTDKEPAWVGVRDVLVIHRLLLAQHGGASGVCVPALFYATISQPKADYEAGESCLAALAASYAASILHDRPFKDGNRRTALVACLLFLNLNGFDLIVPETDAVQAISALAKKKIDERGFRAYLQDNVVRYRRTARPFRRKKLRAP